MGYIREALAGGKQFSLLFKTPGSYRMGDPQDPHSRAVSSTEAENSTENQGFFNGFSIFHFFLLLPSRRGTGRDLQGDLYSHHNTSLIPQQENPSGRNFCLSHPGAEFIGSTIHLLADPTPGRAVLPAIAHQQWGNRETREKTNPHPTDSRAFPTEPHLQLHSQGCSLGSIPAISEFSPIPHFFLDGLAKIQGDGDPGRKEWVGFFWETHEFGLKFPVGGEGLAHLSQENHGCPISGRAQRSRAPLGEFSHSDRERSKDPVRED